MSKNLGIFEPLYATGQTLCNKAFQPWKIDNNDHAEWREFRLLLDFYQQKKHEKYDFSGIISPKFSLKTMLPGEAFIDFIHASEQADVCLINAFSPLSYISYNVWMHGEAFHPGLIKRAQDLLNASGIDIELDKVPRHDHRTLCYSNFWVGTPHFWHEYSESILKPIENYLLNHPDSNVSKGVLEGTTHTDPAPFLPFIIERLFSTFISLRDDIRVASFPMDHHQAHAYCLNDFERQVVNSMGEVIDRADEQEDYPAELKQQQQLYTRLYKHYFTEYYTTHPHPHTGYTAMLFKETLIATQGRNSR